MLDNAFRHFSPAGNNSSLVTYGNGNGSGSSGSTNSKTNPEYLCCLNGTIEKVGVTLGEQVLVMTPAENRESIEGKLLKKCKFDVKDASHHMIQGDVVVLTSFFTPSYEAPFLIDHTSPLAGYINTQA